MFLMIPFVLLVNLLIVALLVLLLLPILCLFLLRLLLINGLSVSCRNPSMPAPVICENSFSALKEEVLYDFTLNLGFDDPAPRPMRRFCISAIGIVSPTAANLSVTRTCQSPELEPALDSDLPLTRTCQSPKPVPKSKPDNITSRAVMTSDMCG